MKGKDRDKRKNNFFKFFRFGLSLLSIEGERVKKTSFRKEVVMRGKTRDLAYESEEKEIDEELASVLLAISVLSRRMAIKLIAKHKKNRR